MIALAVWSAKATALSIAKLSVTAPAVPPPLRFVPAVTPVISPSPIKLVQDDPL